MGRVGQANKGLTTPVRGCYTVNSRRMKMARYKNGREPKVWDIVVGRINEGDVFVGRVTSVGKKKLKVAPLYYTIREVHTKRFLHVEDAKLKGKNKVDKIPLDSKPWDVL